MATWPRIRLAVGLLLGALTAEAHHSIAGVYHGNRTVRVEGVVVRFDFVNPHAFVTLDVQAADGAPQRWRLEMDDRGELSEIGMTAETLQAGDRLVVTGNPARQAAHQIYIRRLERPTDGYAYEVGSRPRLRSAGRR
jgi:hypothetical protein